MNQDPTTAKFDPYHVWLGIPVVEQPPDHYRLLGVSRFETSLEVIESAADRQMAHVRSFQNGSRSQDSQRLLNEIAAARVCLLTTTAKRDYDESLRAKSPVVTVTRDSGSSVRGGQPHRRNLPRGWQSIAAIGGLAVLLGVIGMKGVWQFQPDGEEAEVAASGSSLNSAQVESRSVRQTVSTAQAPEKSAITPEPQPKVRLEPDIEESAGFSNLGAEFDALAGLSPEQATDESQDIFASTQSPVSGSSPRPEVSRRPVSRLSVPTEQELREADLGLTSSETHLLTTGNRKRTATELLDVAKSAGVTPAIRYRLIQFAIDQAVEKQNVEVALLAHDFAARQFIVDGWQQKLDCLTSLNQSPTTVSMLSALLNGCRDLTAQALAEGRFAQATQSAQLAVEATSRPQAGHLRANAKSMFEYTTMIESQYDDYRRALARLERDHSESVAHTKVGAWLCLVTNDWANGLPHLAEGDDQQLAGAAKLDLAATRDAVEGMLAGDAWWELGDVKSGQTRFAMKRRALHWYEIASAKPSNSLTGVRIKNRVAEARLATEMFRVGNPPPDDVLDTSVDFGAAN